MGFEWDYRNRLAKAKYYTDTYYPSGDTVTVTFPDVGEKTLYLTGWKDYLYDVHDQLIAAEKYGAYGEGGTLTRAQQFVYRQGHCVVEFDDSGSGAVAYRLYGPGVDMPLAVEHVVPPVDPNPAIRHVIWTLTDQQGTVRALACDEGATFETWHVKYTAFGVPTRTGGLPALVNTFYAGRDLDRFTGLYNNRARWYDAGAGRFLSEDPLSFAAGDANLYGYCGNSPTNFTDPSGCVALVDDMIILGLIGLNLWVWGNNAVMADAVVQDQPINPSNTPYSADYWKGAAMCTTVGAALPLVPYAASYVLPAWAATGVVTTGGVALGGYGLYKEGSAAWQSYRQGNYFQAAYHTANVALIGYVGYRAFARPTAAPTTPIQQQSPLASRSYYAGAGIDAETGAVAASPGLTTVAYAGAGISAEGVAISSAALTSSSIIAMRGMGSVAPKTTAELSYYWWKGRYSTPASQPGAYKASSGKVFPTRRNSGLSGEALRSEQEAFAEKRLAQGNPVEVVRGQAREAGLTVFGRNERLADRGAEKAIQRALDVLKASGVY